MAVQSGWWRTASRFVLALAAGAALAAALYQLPAQQVIDLGGPDAALTQGFADQPVRDDARLAGSDGSARLLQGSAALVLPQFGWPLALALHARAADDAATMLQVLQSDQLVVAPLRIDATWRAQSATLTTGWWRPSDTVVELRADAALLDRVTVATAGWPIVPAPWIVGYVMLASGAWAWRLGWLAGTPRSGRHWGLALGTIALVLLCYRHLPLGSMPLRRAPHLLALLSLAVAAWPVAIAAVRRRPAWIDAAALTLIIGWGAVIAWQSASHVTLAIPGVENDFRVFALRSARLFGQYAADGNYRAATDGVLRADGFYHLGYPLLLWLTRPLASDNPFLAARALAVLSGMLLLAAGWLLARNLLGRVGALISLAWLASSPVIVAAAHSLGTDLPFAACCGATLALLTQRGRLRRWQVVLAGACAGAALLVRHPGIVLLLIGWLALWWRMPQARWPALGWFTIAGCLVFLPQLAVNLRDTGQPLHAWQAKNIWLAAYADGDWQRWNEVPDDIGLGELIIRDPLRIAGNWWANVRAVFGSGAEDTGEFGRSIIPRMLTFPGGWLALVGVLHWMLAARHATRPRIVLAWLVAYVLLVSIGLALPRFYLPLAPVIALAAAGCLLWLGRQLAIGDGTRLVLVLAFATAGVQGLATGANDVLTRQPADAVSAVASIQRHLAPGTQWAAALGPRDPLAKYSAIAHRVGPLGDAALWLGDTSAVPPAGATLLEAFGRYRLYRVE